MTFEQAKGVANAVLGGDPDAGAVVSHTASCRLALRQVALR